MFTFVPQGIEVVNETAYPTKTVERLVRFALEHRGVERLSLNVRVIHSRHQYATGFWRDYWYPEDGEDRPQILLRIPRRDVVVGDYVPYHREREQGKRFALADWKEALVAIAAHEAEHARQNASPMPRGRGRKRRVDVELRCDLAAFRAVRDWRAR